MVINWAQQADRVAREDIVLFINSCLSCTGQREFYEDGHGQRVSIAFLHEYILVNYRLLYARTLATGVNHFNRAQIILNLLASGQKTASQHRREEGELINAALNSLPPQRAWDVLQQLRKRGINNRRSRAIARDYLQGRRNISFDSVKYRPKVRAAAAHAHLNLDGEVGRFLFGQWNKQPYATEIFEHYRQAHYSVEAVYKLPFTVAEGLARKHKIDRSTFLEKISQRMTIAEKLRFQKTAVREDVLLDVELSRIPLTKLALYILSLPIALRVEKRTEFNRALRKAAVTTLRKSPLKLGRVAAVLDCSYSSSGSSEKRRRPLGVAMAAHYMLEAASREYKAFWTTSIVEPLLVHPHGQTDLARPLLDALDWGADTVIIVSDGWENDPPGAVQEIIRVFRDKIDREHKVSLIHCNPVFDADSHALRIISSIIPTVGLRDADDLPTSLGFARFAEGTASLAELEAYLAKCVKEFLGRADEQEVADSVDSEGTEILAAVEGA